MKLVSLTPVAVMLAAVSAGAGAGPVESTPVAPVAAQNPEGGCGDMGQKPAEEKRQAGAGEGGCGSKGQARDSGSAPKPAGSPDAGKAKEGGCGEGMCGAGHKHKDNGKKETGSSKKAK